MTKRRRPARADGDNNAEEDVGVGTRRRSERLKGDSGVKPLFADTPVSREGKKRVKGRGNYARRAGVKRGRTVVPEGGDSEVRPEVIVLDDDDEEEEAAEVILLDDDDEEAAEVILLDDDDDDEGVVEVGRESDGRRRNRLTGGPNALEPEVVNLIEENDCAVHPESINLTEDNAIDDEGTQVRQSKRLKNRCYENGSTNKCTRSGSHSHFPDCFGRHEGRKSVQVDNGKCTKKHQQSSKGIVLAEDDNGEQPDSEDSEVSATLAVSSSEPDPDALELDALPMDILENVLSRLPLVDFLKMRRLCTVWDDLLSSPPLCTSCPCLQRPWFLEGLLVVDHSRGDLAICKPFGKSINYFVRIPTTSSRLTMSQQIVSAGGLVCCLQGEGNRTHRLITVFNPLTKAMRELPSYPRFSDFHDLKLLTMVVINPVRHHYKVVLRGKGGHRLVYCIYLIVYDSVTNSWTISNAPVISPPRPRNESLEDCGCVYKQGLIYVITSTCREKLVVFDTRKRPKNIAIPYPRGIAQGPKELLQFQGKLFTVGPTKCSIRDTLPRGSGSSMCQKNLAVCIWELREPSLEWIEVSRMPDRFVDVVGSGHHHTLEFRKLGSLVIILSFRSGTRVRDRDVHRSVIYDFSKNLWFRAPDLLSTARSITTRAPVPHGYTNVLFEPRLDARP